MNNEFFENIEKNNNERKEHKEQKENIRKVKKENKVSNNNGRRLVIAIMLMAIGIFSCIYGTSSIDYYGVYESPEIYGGDAYTGIQNAATTTANNINELGDTISNCFKGLYLVIGATIFTCGVSLLPKRERD